MRYIHPRTSFALPLILVAACQSDLSGSEDATESSSSRAQQALDNVYEAPKDLSLIVVQPDASLDVLTQTIEQLKGTVFHVAAPRMVVARLPAGAEAALGQLGMAAHFERAVADGEIASMTPLESYFVRVFNNRYYAPNSPLRIATRHTVRPEGEPFETAPRSAAQTRSLLRAHDPQSELDAEASSYVPYASGKVVVSILLPESNGVAEPSTEDWSEQSILETYTKVQTALEAIARHEPNSKLQFILHYESAPANGGLPGTIDHDWEFTNNCDWLQGAEEDRSMQGIYGRLLGHPVDSLWSGAHEYVNRLRTLYNADGAFVVAVANSTNSGQWIRAHAWLNGPSTTLGTGNSWEVFAHEFGHIFGANDEYCPDACATPNGTHGYLGMLNANATYYPGGDTGINDGQGEMQPSLMTYNQVDSVNGYTRGAWGWLDTDGDGLIEVRDTAPVSDLTLDVDRSGVLRATGWVTDIPAAPLWRTPFSANRITALQYRFVGALSSPWFEVALSGQTRGREQVGIELGSLPEGSYDIELRAVNSVGNVEKSPVRHRVLSTAAVNAAPQLALTTPSVVGSTASTFAVRAEPLDLQGQHVQVRFDADGDGAWDGPFSTSLTTSATFPAAGRYVVRAEAKNASGVVTEKSLALLVLDGAAPAVATFAGAGTPIHGEANPAPTFTIDSSFDPDGHAVQYRWLSERIDANPTPAEETAWSATASPFTAHFTSPGGLVPHPIDLSGGDPALANTYANTVVALDGGYVAVALGIRGLGIVDISDRKAPKVVAQLPLETTAKSMVRKGKYLYVLGGPLTVVNVTNPTHPVEVKQNSTTNKVRKSVQLFDEKPLTFGAGESVWITHELSWDEKIKSVRIELVIEHPQPADLDIRLQLDALGMDPIQLRSKGTPGPAGLRSYVFTKANVPALGDLTGQFATDFAQLIVSDVGSTPDQATRRIASSELRIQTRYRATPVLPGMRNIAGVMHDNWGSDAVVLYGLGVQVLDATRRDAIFPVAQIGDCPVINTSLVGTNALILCQAPKPEEKSVLQEAIAEIGATSWKGQAPASAPGLHGISLSNSWRPKAVRYEPEAVGQELVVVGSRMYLANWGEQGFSTTVGSPAAFFAKNPYVLGTTPLRVSTDAFGDDTTVYAIGHNGGLVQLDVSNPAAIALTKDFRRPYASRIVRIGAEQVLFPETLGNSTWVDLNEFAYTTSSLYRITLQTRDAAGAMSEEARTVHLVPYDHAPVLNSVSVVSGTNVQDQWVLHIDATDPDNGVGWDPNLVVMVDTDGDGNLDRQDYLSATGGDVSLSFPTAGVRTLTFRVRDGFWGMSEPVSITVDVEEWQPSACSDEQPCVKGQFCRYDVGVCGAPGTEGSCQLMPWTCEGWGADPVCGCDGTTYDNECVANSAGVSVMSRGACPQIVCGGPDALVCPDNMFCVFPEGATCGADLTPGVCEFRPEMCMPGYAPVCGCDGQSYPNACAAERAGTSVRDMGSCPAPDDCRVVGCGDGQTCMRCWAGYTCMPDGSTC